MWMKNSSDNMGNRTRDIPPCSAVSQPTAQPGTPQHLCIVVILNAKSYLDIVHPVQYSKLIIINLLNPTGYVMHRQFNIQQLYALPTLYLCVLYLSGNKQRLVPLTA